MSLLSISNRKYSAFVDDIDDDYIDNDYIAGKICILKFKKSERKKT
jgi:hypothetical protein